MFHKLKNPSASVGKDQYFKTMEFSISFTHVYREGEKILLFLLIYIYSKLVLYLLGNLFKNSTKSFLPWSSLDPQKLQYYFTNIFIAFIS